MSQTAQNQLIWISFGVAFFLMIMPLPYWLVPFRPNWVLLVLIYWCFSAPDKVGVFVGWGLGFVLDVMMGTLIGQRALSMAIVSYAGVKLHQRTRIYPMWQQALTVLLLLLLNQLFVLWINGIIGRPPNNPLYWAPSFVGAFFWPWVFYLLSAAYQKMRIS